MGTQQLMLAARAVVVTVVLIGIGFAMFGDHAASQNRDSLTNDLVHFASQARKYYRRPAMLRGGMKMSELTSRPTNQNGTYTLPPEPVPNGERSCTIVAFGKEQGQDEQKPVKMTVKV